MEFLTSEFKFVWKSGLFLLICLILFVIGKIVYKLFHSKIKIDHLLVEKDNFAFALSYIGYFIGLIFAIGGIINSEGNGVFWDEIILTGAIGIASIFLLNISGIVFDKLIMSKINLQSEIITEQNTAAGLVKAGNYISIGIIIMGVLLVDINKPIEAGFFLILSILLVFFAAKFYDIITPFKIQKEIDSNNVAVAIAIAGAQISFALIVQSGIQISHVNWIQSLTYVSINVFVGLLILPIIRLITDSIFLTGRKLTDELINQEQPNIGAGIIEAFGYIGGALLFIWCWNL